jgi:hypothetical protein
MNINGVGGGNDYFIRKRIFTLAMKKIFI